MEALVSFFEWINSLLGVSSGAELLAHPVVIGAMIALFVISILMGWKMIAVLLAGVLGGGLIFQNLYPANPSDLGELLKFLGAMGGLAILLVYFGFVR